MSDHAAPAPQSLELPAALLAAWPHLPAFWPGVTVRATQADIPLPFATGPFRPARLGRGEVPVALVLGAPGDPVGTALATPVPPPSGIQSLLARVAAGRIGAPPDLPDPGPAALNLAPRSAAILLDPGDPRRRAELEARLVALRCGPHPAVVAADPFVDAPPVLPDALPRLDPWTLLDAAAELHGASRDLALLGLAAGVRIASGLLAGADPATAWGALLAATRCVNPFTAQPCGLEEALEILALWKKRAAEGRRVAACLGVLPYKRARIVSLLGRSTPPVFAAGTEAGLRAARMKGGALLAWSAAAPADLRRKAAAAGVELLWLEDGFIRSAGLGAEFRAGASFALDAGGPYYDPAVETDLERLLNSAELPPALLRRAAALREAIVARGVTKYNLPGGAPAIAAPPGRRRILVPGQVEDDASVLRGGGAVRSNLALLQAVRAAEPDAFLVYKPHPDLEAGFRRGRIPAARLKGLADQVLTGAPMAEVLRQVDAVHTITSLTGFEALLRGLPVTCWGRPFYAGWGLTEDREPPLRPRRKRSLDELVAVALILYPRCVDPLTELPCPPEVLLDRMARPDLFPTGARGGLRAVQGIVMRWLARWRNWQ